MKTKTTLLTLAALAAVSALPAQETAKKERRIVAERIAHEPMEKREPATFLGVETIPVNPTITEQLSLPKGVGLIVRSVVPDSPAAGALKPHDILTKLDDQLLIETRQLAVLIRSHKENDEVSLTYVRGGKETTAKVKLTKRDLPKEFGHRLEGGPMMENHMFYGAPAGMPGNTITIRPGGAPAARVRVLNGGPRFTAGTQLNLEDSKLLYSDDKGSLEVTTQDGKRTVVAKNPKGDVVYNGPIDTPEQREAVPQEVRERLDRMEHVDHLTFERLAPPPPEAGPGGPQAMEMLRGLHHDSRAQDGMLM